MRIIDPIHPNNDLGQRVKAAELQKMFRAAYILLHSEIG